MFCKLKQDEEELYTEIIRKLIMSLTFTSGRFVIVQFLLKFRKECSKRIVSRNNIYRPKPGLIKFPILAGVLFSWRAQEKHSCPPKSPISSFLEHADQLFEIGHYEECLQYLNNCQEDVNVEIQWRICRVMYNMAKQSKYDKAYKKELILQAFILITETLEKNDENYAVQKWYALLLDAYSAQIGIKERISQLENVKKHMDLAVTYNPNDATTLYMLGEWCYQVSEMPWHQRKIAETLFGSPPYSSYEDALEYFLRAESTQPRFYSLNLLRLGICYLKLNKEDQAKYYLNLAASYPAKSNDDHRANKEAAELLKRLK